MQKQIATLKVELKVLALKIRELKSKRKELKGYVPGLFWTQEQFRIKHITRCLLRGRTMEQIEPKLRDPGSSQHKWVYKKVDELKAKLEKEAADEQQAVHPST